MRAYTTWELVCVLPTQFCKGMNGSTYQKKKHGDKCKVLVHYSIKSISKCINQSKRIYKSWELRIQRPTSVSLCTHSKLWLLLTSGWDKKLRDVYCTGIAIDVTGISWYSPPAVFTGTMTIRFKAIYDIRNVIRYYPTLGACCCVDQYLTNLQ